MLYTHYGAGAHGEDIALHRDDAEIRRDVSDVNEDSAGNGIAMIKGGVEQRERRWSPLGH